MDRDMVLKVEDLHKSYGEQKVLKGISFEIYRGETKVIAGPSGSGKSTLLRCINQLTRPDKGRVWLEGVELTDPNIDINKMRQKIGFVFQHFNLFSHLKAIDNVMVGLIKVKKMPKDEARKRAEDALLSVHITQDLWEKYPAQLSGGQQQRVAIARALAMDPVIILYDEPTSALDPQLIGEVLEVMKELSKKHITSLVVTHEMGFALSVADEIMFMYDGKILERGPPKEVIFRPKHEAAANFFRRIHTLYGKEGTE